MIVAADSGPLHYLILLDKSIFAAASTARSRIHPGTP
jgi:hypothetical protein